MQEFHFDSSRCCPQCGNAKIKGWSQLTNDEQELVKRLPASAKYKLQERKARHSWCKRCWYEFTNNETHHA
jgi:hypothetical protein